MSSPWLYGCSLTTFGVGGSQVCGVLHVAGGEVIGDGREVPTPMSDLAGVAGEVLSSLLRENSELVGVGFRADGDGDMAVLS